MTSETHWVITFSCLDMPGIVLAVSGAVVAARGNITESQQYSSPDTGTFFMRIQVMSAASHDEMLGALRPVAERFSARLTLDVVGRPVRTLVLVSKAAHCLNNLLFRQMTGHLPVDIELVLSNHPDLESLTSFYGVEFEHHAVTAETRADVEARIAGVVAERGIELVILARYMQILSPELCGVLAGRAINIHHSFLPGFKGANPYRQAHERGVKLIGATANFVTPDLDEGPIIEQSVVRVNHAKSVSELMEIGRDEESRTLTEAVRLVAEHRVLLDGIRTVIFS